MLSIIKYIWPLQIAFGKGHGRSTPLRDTAGTAESKAIARLKLQKV